MEIIEETEKPMKRGSTISRLILRIKKIMSATAMGSTMPDKKPSKKALNFPCFDNAAIETTSPSGMFCKLTLAIMLSF